MLGINNYVPGSESLSKAWNSIKNVSEKCYGTIERVTSPIFSKIEELFKPATNFIGRHPVATAVVVTGLIAIFIRSLYKEVKILHTRQQEQIVSMTTLKTELENLKKPLAPNAPKVESTTTTKINSNEINASNGDNNAGAGVDIMDNSAKKTEEHVSDNETTD
jgi:hypothetical protein